MAAADAPTGIRTQGSLWAKLIDQHASEQIREEARRGDAFVYFVGNRASGKSTLLNRFLFPNKSEAPRPSEGLEYTFVRKPSTFDHERKDLGLIWEVGSSQEFAEEITKGSNTFLTPNQVATAVVVVVLDLSDPGSVVPTALTWLALIQKKLASSYRRLEQLGAQVPEQLKQRARSKVWGQHEDRDLVSHTGISVVLAATKFDAFMNNDAEQLRVMARALRCIAHTHGAHLIMLGSLQPGSSGGGGSKGSAQLRACQEEFGRLLNHLMFVGPDKKLPAKAAPQLDHLGPLFVPAGADKLRDIGQPRGPFTPGSSGSGSSGSSGSGSSCGQAEALALVEEWRRVVAEVFPAKAREAKAGAVGIDARYSEEAIDALKARKEEQLSAYRREQDATKQPAREATAHATSTSAAPAVPAVGSGNRSGHNRGSAGELQRQQVGTHAMPAKQPAAGMERQAGTARSQQ